MWIIKVTICCRGLQTLLYTQFQACCRLPWLQSYHDNKRVQIICYISGVESIKAALHYCYDLTRINNWKMCGISLFFYIAQSKEWWSWQLTNISTPAICIGDWSDRLWFNTLIISWWYLEKMSKLGLFSPFQGDYSSELYLCIFLIQPFWWITENL